MLDYLGAIDALRPPRRARAPDRRAGPRLAVGAEVARLRCLRGIDTLSAVGLCAEVGDFERFARAGAADELPRPRPVRALQRREPPARARSPSRAPGTPAGCWSRRPGTTAARRGDGRELAAARTASPRDGLAIAWRPSSACTAPGRAWISSAASAARSSRSPSPASWPASAGRSPQPTEPGPARRGRGGGGQSGPSRERIRDSAMSNPRPATLDPRQRALATKPGPAATRIRAYQPDRASRTRRTRRPLNRKSPPDGGPRGAGALTNDGHISCDGSQRIPGMWPGQATGLGSVDRERSREDLECPEDDPREYAALRHNLRQVQRELTAVQETVLNLEGSRRDCEESLSWKVTRPLRAARRIARSLRPRWSGPRSPKPPGCEKSQSSPSPSRDTARSMSEETQLCRSASNQSRDRASGSEPGSQWRAAAPARIRSAWPSGAPGYALLALIIAGVVLRLLAIASWWPATTTLDDGYELFTSNPFHNNLHPAGIR